MKKQPNKPKRINSPKHTAKDYEALKAEWYGKLKTSGFDDIEQDDGNLKVWSKRFSGITESRVKQEAKRQYYQLAEQFLEIHKFENEIERLIWEYHTNGMSAQQISGTLKGVGIKKERSTVSNVVTKTANAMKTYFMSKRENSDSDGSGTNH